MKRTPTPGIAIQDDAGDFRNREDAARAISVCYQTGEEWRIPLFQAAYRGWINLAIAQAGQRIPDRVLQFSRPTLIILADDRPGATGPVAWPQAKQLIRWAGGCILHASGGTVEHSKIAVAMALEERRGLLIEMEYCRHPLWAALVERERRRRPLQALSIVPPRGVHPLPGVPRGTVLQ